ncbi:hypothetical protein J3R83DRAFT_8356 [Lanmaoa asiatica]|nr:hypothetical protein J3R83DRAFT_8356 [Lanmaoa asiatica]
MHWIAKLAAVVGYLAFNPPPEPDICPQSVALYPSVHAQIAAELDLIYTSPKFKHSAYNALSGAVRIPTESWDDPVDWDPQAFIDLHDYLQETFPRVYNRLSVTKINTYGLVFHWQGSTDAKPFLSAAHQDVVPVDPSTWEEWEHLPYSGYHDGELLHLSTNHTHLHRGTWIWGRGTCDNKGDLIQKLIVIDALLQRGFSPVRTIVLAFGFDEELGGQRGAAHIASYLEHTYGRDAFAMVIDEGSPVSDYGDGVYFASPALSEKGYFNVRIEVATAGGHSSLPPAHTSIGYLAQFITTLEESPHVPQLHRNGTPFNFTMCLAEYSPFFPDPLRLIAREAMTNDTALSLLKHGLLAVSPVYGAIFGTTQAADVVEGGVKVNALPERAAVIVNHRIAEHSTVTEVQQHLVQVLLPVAREYDLTLDAFGQLVHTGRAGSVSFSDENDSAFNPSPVTPSDDVPYSILAGTIRATMESSNFYNVTQVVVAPSLFMGSHLVYTRHYWNLTKHIFRFSPATSADYYNGLHTVNEALRAEAMIEGIRFHTNLILNLDESSLP